MTWGAAPWTRAPTRRPPLSPNVSITARSWWRISTGLSLVAAASLLAVMMGEIDRLIASVLDPDGRSQALNVVLSPMGIAQTHSWTGWALADLNEVVGSLIALSAGLDLLFVAAYFGILHRFIRVVYRRRRRVARVALVTLVAFEVVEDLVQLMAGGQVRLGDEVYAQSLGTVMAFFTAGKWLSLVVLAAAVLRSHEYRAILARRLSRFGQALWVHRLAAIAILLLVFMACIPAADLLDQLPDIQRQWADREGLWHALWAAGILTATAIATYVLGRRRTRFIVQTRVRGWALLPARSPLDAAAPWLIAPVSLIVIALVMLTQGAEWGPDIHPWSFLSLVGVFLLIACFAAVGWQQGGRPALPLDPMRARASWITGDVLAAVVLVVGGLGVVRSYTVPLVLFDPASSTSPVAAWLVPVATLVSVVVAPLLLFLANRVGPGNHLWAKAGLHPNAPQTAQRLDGLDRVSDAGVTDWVVLVVAASLLIVAMLWPTQIASTIGGTAVALGAVTTWAMLFGAFTLIVQPREVIVPFSWLRFKAAPVLTLAVILPFILNLVTSSMDTGDVTLHAVQVSNPTTKPAAIGGAALAKRLDALQRDAAYHPECLLDAGGAKVRPVYVIAAEGGGIRAAYWTAAALAALDGCAAKSGFVAFGISGGSVGLAIASTADDGRRLVTSEGNDLDADGRRAAEIVARTKATAGPEVVSSIILGLTVGDIFGAGTGLHVPSNLEAPDGIDAAGADDVGWRWRDRAALGEAMWERAAPGLASPFSNELDPLTGAVILTSTDVIAKCRVLVDQGPIRVTKPTSTPSPAADLGCDATGGMPSMLEFLDPSERPGARTAACLASLDWSTAAMLSARFGLITPSGVLPAEAPCDKAAKAQLVDGGFVDGTSLSAVADTAPGLAELIAERNASSISGQALLMPVMLYLRNTQGYDLAEDLSRAEAEPLVPITGGAAKSNLVGEDAWLQRISIAWRSACPDGDAPAGAGRCRAALEEFMGPTGKLPGGVVIVAPASTPSVMPPLGWALSEMSQKRFTAAMSVAAGCHLQLVDDLAAVPATATAKKPVRTRLGGYTGFAGFAKVIDFDPCKRLAAQEDSITLAPRPAGAGD